MEIPFHRFFKCVFDYLLQNFIVFIVDILQILFQYFISISSSNIYFYSFGTTHFCAACHDEFQRLMCLPKQLLPKCPVGPKGMQLEGGACPLKIQHPPTGEEFALGCGICRNLSTF